MRHWVALSWVKVTPAPSGTSVPSSVSARSARFTLDGATASSKAMSMVSTAVVRGLGLGVATLDTPGATSSTNTLTNVSGAVLDAASATRRRMWWAPGDASVKLLVKCWAPGAPVTVASPSSVPVVVSVSRTRRPLSGRSPVIVSVRLRVSPSLTEMPVSGLSTKLLGASGRTISIVQLSATCPVPALPARSRRPAPFTVSV